MSSSIVAILKALRSAAPSVEDERHGNNEFLRSRTTQLLLRSVAHTSRGLARGSGPDSRLRWA